MWVATPADVAAGVDVGGVCLCVELVWLAGGFLPGTNDPSVASIEVSNVYQPKQFDVVGRVEDRVIFTKSVVLPTSSAKLEVRATLHGADNGDAAACLSGSGYSY